MSKIILTGLLASLFLTQVTWADAEKLHYNQINLSATASNEIKNDILVAILYAQEKGSDPKNRSHQVNKKSATPLSRLNLKYIPWIVQNR